MNGNTRHGHEPDAFGALWSPLTVRSVTLANRIGMAPMHANLGNEVGGVTNRLLRYLEARARGGPGLIMVEHLIVDWPVGKNHARCLSIADDGAIPGLRDVVEMLHDYGVVAGAPLDHAGGQTRTDATQGMKPVGPSAVPVRPGLPAPRALQRDEIADVVGAFARAANRACRAGFDIVELHAGHGYLLGQFLSPIANQRDDSYGGSLQNRARFVLEVCEQVRASVSEGTVLSFRLNVDDYEEGGWRASDTAQLLPLLREVGVDLISFTAGLNNSYTYPAMGDPWPARHEVELVRAAWAGPVGAAGSIDPATAADAISAGTIDLALSGRAFLADALWPAKIRSGQAGSVRPCISCNECLNAIRRPVAISCAVNPDTGREDTQQRLSKAPVSRRIAVVGGGLTGLEAAVTAASHGHQVTIFERAMQLGGQLRLAAMSPLGALIGDLLAFYEAELRGFGVTVELGIAVETSTIAEQGYDRVLLCTGTPEHTSHDSPIDDRSRSLAEVLHAPGSAGPSVLIVGNGHTAAAAAIMCAEAGRTVNLLSSDPLLANEERTRRSAILRKLDERGVTVFIGRISSHAGAGAVVATTADGTDTKLAFDTLVVIRPDEHDANLTNNVDARRRGGPEGRSAIESAIWFARKIARDEESANPTYDQGEPAWSR
jgi:2,4-dienoyl-CoA reductase-like NADH-dependent reductase (Old Yellow Enzyme family)/thioredoxin reductase